MIQNYYNSTITRIRTVIDNRGRQQSVLTLPFRCRIEYGDKWIPGPDGQMQLSTAQIFCDYDNDIVIGDRIYIGTLLTGQETDQALKFNPVIKVDKLRSFTNSHLEVSLG